MNSEVTIDETSEESKKTGEMPGASGLEELSRMQGGTPKPDAAATGGCA